MFLSFNNSVRRSTDYVYSFEQCKEFTRNNNNEIVNSRLQIKEAEQTKKEAFTKYFPSVSATGSAMNASTGTMKMDMMGNTLSLMKNGVLGGVTATQPVFAGGNILNGNKLAKVGLEASKYQAKLSEEESLLLTEQYYWQIVSLQEKNQDHRLSGNHASKYKKRCGCLVSGRYYNFK